MTNNDIFKKLRVALQLRDDQIVAILELVDFRISKGEIGNFFRNEDHPKYVECQDQILRNFLNGLVIYLRGTKEAPKNPREVLVEQNKNMIHRSPAKQDNALKTSFKKPEAKGPATSIDRGAKKTTPKKKTFNAKPSILGNVKFNNGNKNKKTEE